MKKLSDLALIAAIVAVVFEIHNLVDAISPLALCVALGFLAANIGTWPTFAAEGAEFASKKLVRIGVAFLGAQVSIVSLKTIGFKGLITVVLVVRFYNLWNSLALKII